MVTKVDVPTGLVLNVKVAVLAPLRTVTLDGTLATLGLLLERDTATPSLGAGALSITVPVDGLPPVTVDGLRLSEESVGSTTVSVAAVLVTLPAALLTTTLNSAPLSPPVVGGVM